MNRKKYFLSTFVFSFLFFSQIVCGATEDFVFDNPQEQKQFEKLLKEFRCVTCPNQNIADSGSPVAGAMRQEIYSRYKNGESQECIRNYLFSHYGEYVSYRPSVKIKNFPLWMAPFFMSIVGFLIWWKFFTSKKIVAFKE